MKKRILLTSFDTWLKDQQSNSSDDLLLEVTKLELIPHDLTFLRQLPVDVQLASTQVREKIKATQPDYIICCGMAASRTQLSVEAVASCKEIVLQTEVDLEKLVAGAAAIQISYDCGKFVCEGLYYSVLDYLSQNQLTARCIFVHVPVLNQENLIGILADFVLIINKLALSSSC
ncbi:pyroglutamyl-peptidase I family protein [Nostoc sp. 'Lobaria pulmonaria (5183) cyanobiont']|uniref:pyroglutamyl-peptidase I family protein n=1 Tax=Nostoc sp. 'Lobaria pulmonaria (5183) cyanobiont' TaxID=1618022 RepID=UPI000CF32D9F|nr:peptidase C15 [Nostoc sp. 'Lobaria pulmonaria (5183) cyanobiont']AVH73075.1 peptidase C15/pyroglutamyl peptidase I [Nostoc sp. 'Lobaria pulmonaria (5183) cyanobiont']